MQPNVSPLTLTIDKMLSTQNAQQKNTNKQFIDSLPKQFVQFLKEKDISLVELTVPIPRYVRKKPTSDINAKKLADKLQLNEDQVIKIDDQFFALPPEVKINNCQYYQNGEIYGIDYSSCIPVRCLCAEEGDKILQLCSAPGNKSMYLADCLKEVDITGVEININRANVMKNLISKYGLDGKINVCVEDGLTFNNNQLFDRVLVDAECTHEGSIKHIKKFMPKYQTESKQKKKQKKNFTKQQQRQYELNNSNPYTTSINKANEWSMEDFKQRFLDEKKLNNLESLQSGLLKNGFRLLKPGGIIVYSTCSFDSSQNQNIIENFLAENEDAYLMDCKDGLNCAVEFSQGRLKETIRFCPSVSRCGGMFVCKIKKKENKIEIENTKYDK